MDENERLREIVAYSKLSDRAFAIKCGLKQSTFSRQLNSVCAISLDTINAILATFPEISAEWLMRGTGCMLLSDEANKHTQRVEDLLKTISTLQEIIDEKNKIIETLMNKK